jgi:hypothetical protein
LIEQRPGFIDSGFIDSGFVDSGFIGCASDYGVQV